MADKYLTFLGIISMVIGIIKGLYEIKKLYNINKKIKIKVSKSSLILILIGVVMFISGILIVNKLFKCNHPYIKITEYSKNSSVENYYSIEGRARCFPNDFRVAILIHRMSQTNFLEGWFINGECAYINNRNKWNLNSVEIGTSNTKGFKYEIYAYAVPDSICLRISKIINDRNYQGSVTRPQIFQGVFDMIEIQMK